MKNNCAKKILVVDDETDMRMALGATLKREGHNCQLVDNGISALDLFEKEDFDMVVTDVKMPRMSGLDLLRELKARNPKTLVIMITAYGTIDNAVECMKEDAFDYLLKPFSADILTSTINRAFMSEVPEGPSANKAAASTTPKASIRERRIITQNKEMQQLLAFVENIAYSKSTVLIAGESGTGKEMVARYIHQCSPRADKPFVAVNCAALPEGLLETELFGHEKGAFTGASCKKDGKFELANRGTLLLDEVSEMSLPLQAKLLRVLQEHEIDKVGGREPVPVDVRIIATSNAQLKKRIEENAFREDLYYRLNVIPLTLPPLRERKEDIPVLADHFLEKYCRENEKTITGIAKETYDALCNHHWPGNVRELENTIERAVLVCQGDTLLPSHPFLGIAPETPKRAEASTQAAFRGTVYEMERELIHQTLDESGGNKTKAAEKLGISIRTLRNKLADYREKEKS
ncbi:MAG: sigma-54-dependent transcriptional regulator [Nitrospinales bacterium]